MMGLKVFFTPVNCILLTAIIAFILYDYQKFYFVYRTIILRDSPTTIEFYPNIAVLVEFRAVDQMITVIHNVNSHIPLSWPIQIFHGRTNEDFIRNSTLTSLISSGKIFLTLMNVTYDRSRTSELLTDPKFWQRVRGEKIFFFQIDSIMCSNSPHKITDFLQYDYIGAPWDSPSLTYTELYLVGNGGFSLRSRNKTLTLLALLPYDQKTPEDVWYASNLHRINGFIASVNIAKTFSVESIFYERPLGVHKPFLDCQLQMKLAKTCPEIVLIMSDKCLSHGRKI